MAITQTITSVEQDGGGHTVYNTANEGVISNAHFVSASIVIAVIIYCIFRLLDNAITKTCMGCKRLKNCEKRLEKLERKNA